MAATFQTIPTMNPSESAFVFTMDDNLIKPSSLPTVGTKWRDWDLGQRDREIDPEWRDYVFVDAIEAAPGRRSFVFGKLKEGADADVPFETYYDNEFYRWPRVVKAKYNLVNVVMNISTYGSGTSDVTPVRKFLVKPPAEVESMVKIERFQNAVPWDASKMRHRKPITSDIGDLVKDCLHPDIRIERDFVYIASEAYYLYPAMGTKVDLFFPATNFTDWSPFVLKDSQKQVNGMWVREKVTIYPPIGEHKTGIPKMAAEMDER